MLLGLLLSFQPKQMRHDGVFVVFFSLWALLSSPSHSRDRFRVQNQLSSRAGLV